MRPGGANAENAAMEEERNFEREIMNCASPASHAGSDQGIGPCGSAHEGSRSAQETGDAQERTDRETAFLREGTGPTPSRAEGA